MKTLSKNDFSETNPLHLAKKQNAAIFFGVDWCIHCKNLHPLWEKLSKKAAFINMYFINCDDNPELISEINRQNPGTIASYPTILLYKNGKMIDKFEEERTEQNLLNKFMQIGGK